jgi:hypothetical protein
MFKFHKVNQYKFTLAIQGSKLQKKVKNKFITKIFLLARIY